MANRPILLRMDEHNENTPSKMSEMKAEMKDATGIQNPSGTGQPNPEAGIASLPHWMVIFSWLGLIVNIILLVTKGKESAYFRANAAEGVNVGIWRVIFDIIGWVTLIFIVGWFILAIAFLYCTIFGIIAGIYTVQAKTDTPPYRYPLPFRFAK